MTKKSKTESNDTLQFISNQVIKLGYEIDKIKYDVSLSSLGIDNKDSNKRPDILISKYGNNESDSDFINGIIFYCEAKDKNTKINDRDWIDAIKQGLIKSDLKNLNKNFFGVTNFNTTYVYSVEKLKEINFPECKLEEIDTARVLLNGFLINTFPSFDVVNLIELQLKKGVINIINNQNVNGITETEFQKILSELKTSYRNIDFDNINGGLIDFTIGMITLKMAEEKYKTTALYTMEGGGKKIVNLEKWWSDFETKTLKADIKHYIDSLNKTIEFGEFKELTVNIKKVLDKIDNIDLNNVYNTIEKIGSLHSTRFDIFGSIYEEYANNQEKKTFGEFFTRRNYTHTLVKILFSEEKIFNESRKFKVLDPTCGTGGFLTEVFKTLKENYIETNTYSLEATQFLSKECIYGTDIKSKNIAKTKLNMFLIGDGHSNIKTSNSMDKKDFKNQFDKISFDYIVANPPYGSGNAWSVSSYFNTDRKELAFLFRIIELLSPNGKACVIIPDGILENDNTTKAREEFLKLVNIDAIISLPIHAFAPYTKEKTYALFFTKRMSPLNDFERSFHEKIWMYIIDHDGYANSDKRYPTKLKGKEGKWIHDELSPWVDNQEKPNPSILEERFLQKFDDRNSNSSWINTKGELQTKAKGGHIPVSDILASCKVGTAQKNIYSNFILLPEFYLRKIETNTGDLSKGTIPLLDVFMFKKQKAKKSINGIEYNTNLTEEKIYSMVNQIVENNKNVCPVFSGATENEGIVGYVPYPELTYDLISQNKIKECIFIDNEMNEINLNHIKYSENPEKTFNRLISEDNGYIIINDITYFINNKDMLTIVADGIAGHMFVRKNKEYPIFATNISCWVAIPKVYIQLDNFLNKYQKQFIEIEQGQGVRHFTLEKIKKIKVEINF